jgi:hypothetical protein
MIRIRGPTDLSSIADPELRNLVQLRLAQLSDGEPYDRDVHGEMIVVDVGDGTDDLESVVGFPVLTNPFDGHHYGHPDFVPACEVIEDHGHCHEMVFVLSDEGTGVILFVPKKLGIDPELLSMCAAFAVPSIN